MASIGTGLLLVTGGFVAGIVGTAGGITSLVSYPVLLVAGLTPFAANAANLVALVASWPGSAAVSRREVREQRSWLPWGLGAAALGGAAGTVLLLTTPTEVFDRIVPLLVLLGSATLLLQPTLTRAVGRRFGHRQQGLWYAALTLLVVAVVSVYGGYFGAGSGVMLLVTALVLLDGRMPVANAVKNMLAGASTAASAVVLVVAGPVAWWAVLPLGLGVFLGGLVGPVVARRLPAAVIRWVVALLGVALAVELALGGGA